MTLESNNCIKQINVLRQKVICNKFDLLFLRFNAVSLATFQTLFISWSINRLRLNSAWIFLGWLRSFKITLNSVHCLFPLKQF